MLSGPQKLNLQREEEGLQAVGRSDKEEEEEKMNNDGNCTHSNSYNS
jgi:hypothetical protein